MLESRTRLEPPRWSAAGSSALSRGCPMKHVSAVLVIAALFAVAASGRAQVQQGAPPPSAPPADAPVAAAPRDTLGPAVPPAHPVRRAPSRPASRSSDRVAQSIEPPGAQPRLRRKSARLRTVGGSGAYLCAATPMVPAAGAVSLAVPADAVVSATDVVPTTRVVAASPPPSVDRRYSASFGRRGNLR